MIPGFRRLPDGTVVETRRLLLEGDEPPWLDRLADDGRTHRERIAAADALLAQIAAGWRPSAADLCDAPLIDGWIPMVAEDGTVLFGEVVRHPLIRDGRTTTTSMLLALDGNRLWARTISRFYRLGRPLGRRDDA